MCINELWDGFVVVVFGDGDIVGVMFDCNGLWFVRYKIMCDGFVVFFE